MDLDLDRIARAAREVDPVFRNTPQFVEEQLAAALGRPVLIKLETANPIRSFKGRGADTMLATLPAGTPVVCASSGNFGQAVAYAGRKRGQPVEVFVPHDLNPDKRRRMETFGARLTPVGEGSAEARLVAAEQVAERPGTVFIEDGRQPEIAEGAGTIGVELAGAEFDTIVLPVGDGALITGVARWLKAHRPDVRVVGVCATGSQAMLRSVEAGAPVTVPAATIADGIAVSTPIEEAVARVRALVDEFVLVDDAALLDAMALTVRCVGVLPEPSGAAGIAAIATATIAGDRLATVITGANPSPDVAATVAARLHNVP
ncbi:threonine ammonia-lyase [Microlunatus parietis]|uniref:Threonine dehydratase n=1 Tax=Microlunatus parietis TaxID=682979 RepID=A0A7Y9I7T0_9ACTN|nr:pyridoxal-phosphate dependent enzyme [Microlunatus parietis]NYE71906.1 threonine dehydratase [Microlunatus parietis]